MFQRLTASARVAVTLAQEEARTSGKSQIGTDHLLIALAGDGDDTAAQALRTAGVTQSALRAAAGRAPGLDADALALLGIDLDQVRSAAEQRFGRGALDASSPAHASRRHVPFGAPAKRALAAAMSSATALHTGSISSGQLLLGSLSEPDGAGARMLRSCDVDIAALTADVVVLLRSTAA